MFYIALHYITLQDDYLFCKHSIEELMCEVVASAAHLSHYSDTFRRYEAFQWFTADAHQLTHTPITHNLG